jgi:muconolactone D-isomerase
MDFLVRMDTSAVYQLPDRERKELIERESTRGQELHASGILRKVWRLPGQKANVSIWSARDADQLAEALQSLPIWPLITLEITPLATHPLFAEMAREGKD